MTKGLAKGIINGAAVQQVLSNVRSVVSQAIEAAKAASAEASPSKKFAEIGKYMDLGLAKGFYAYAKVVAASSKEVVDGAISTAKGYLLNMSRFISEDMDADPVIRPVVDLSNVASGARAINGMLSGGSTISMGSTKSVKLAGRISADRSENGKSSVSSKSVNYDHSNSGNTTVNVDNLNIQNEDDIRTLALELSKHNRRLQYGYGG